MEVRFAVLGSNSFSGAHFVRRLLSENFTVLGLSRSAEIEDVFRPYAGLDHSGQWEFSQVDLNNSALLARELREFHPSVVVNFASQSMVAQSWEHPEHWYQTNVVGLSRFVSFLEELPSLQRYVHISTPEVYGSTDGWVTENDSFRPTTPYAISRAAGDMHLMAMHRVRNLPVCLTRAANVYGPAQQLYRLIPRALLAARLGRKITLDGGGTSSRAFIHIEDVVDATLRIAMGGEPGRTYHLSTDQVVTIKQLVELVCAITDTEFDSLVEVGPERPGKDDTYMLDSGQVRESLGWEPRIDLETGLVDTLDWVDANIGVLKELPDQYVHKE